MEVPVQIAFGRTIHWRRLWQRLGLLVYVSIMFVVCVHHRRDLLAWVWLAAVASVTLFPVAIRARRRHAGASWPSATGTAAGQLRGLTVAVRYNPRDPDRSALI